MYELTCVISGIASIFVGVSLFRTRKKILGLSLLPEKNFRQLLIIIAVGGISLTILSSIALTNQTNSMNMFDYQTRISKVDSMRFPILIGGVVLGLLVTFISSRLDTRENKVISAVLISIFTTWQSTPRRVVTFAFVVFVILIGAFNYGMVMRTPFEYTAKWDEWTGVVREPKEMILSNSNAGLKQGCILCTKDLQPLESITSGDDIGLEFVFGIFVRLGIFRPELDSYQQFIAFLVAGIMALSSLIVTIGYRSILVGFIFGIFMSLLSVLTIYQSLLITMYWVPGGAAILTSAFVLAFMARANADVSNNKWEGLLYAIGYWIWGFVGALAYLGRSNAGISTLLPALLILLYLLARYRWYTRIGIMIIVMSLGIVMPLLYFRYTLSWRFGIYDPPNPTDIGHSFSHALYVGLGYVTNREDIRWEDLNGLIHARKECSDSIAFLSTNYYRCIGDLYIKTVLSDPDLLIRNLLAKSESILQTSITHLVVFGFLPLLVILIRARFIYLILGVTFIMFLLPGLLVFPYFSYMIGYGEILIAFLVVGVIDILQSLSPSLILSPDNPKNLP